MRTPCRCATSVLTGTPLTVRWCAVIRTSEYFPLAAWVRNGKPPIETDGRLASRSSVCTLSASTCAATTAPTRSATTSSTTTSATSRSSWRRSTQPPANGGSTSMQPPSVRATVRCGRAPTGASSTRNEQRSRTVASGDPCRERTASRASARVAASYGSQSAPAAAFAAAQNRTVPVGTGSAPPRRGRLRGPSLRDQHRQVSAEPVEQLRGRCALGVPEPLDDPQLLGFTGGGVQLLGVLEREVVVAVAVDEQHRGRADPRRDLRWRLRQRVHVPAVGGDPGA